MSYRIPRYLDLPFGYTVEIKQLSHKSFVDEWGEGCYAIWDVDDNGGTIFLDKSRPIKKRRADLVHEVIHAVADFQVKILGNRSVADATD